MNTVAIGIKLIQDMRALGIIDFHKDLSSTNSEALVSPTANEIEKAKGAIESIFDMYVNLFII